MTEARIIVYRTKSPLRKQRWAWQLRAPNNEVVAQGEGYAERCDAAEMAQRVANGTYRTAEVEYL